MTHSRNNSFGITPLLIFSVLFLMGAYFVFAAVQGDYGIFRRVQVEAEIETLRNELDALEADVASLRNKTRRLSDGYLDLDLLDTQARATLGLMRSDEILIH
ncbi:septum formation initiator family protein [uncultured Litoreibacter sp.]|uniref:FtsB family cell division protein n=1 Tax=uncultured Litoreibacter sp. TaxID=1392394 RepID=UPI00260CBF21|nr:septum formation initiator family protein [uncultured Litoreibacter sp.]